MSNEKKTAEDLLKQASEYATKAQVALDAYAAKDDAMSKQAQRTVGVLIDQGVVHPEKGDDFVTKVASDPTYALRMCEQLAKQIASGVDLGKSASNQEADSILKKEASSELDYSISGWRRNGYCFLGIFHQT